MKPESRNRWMIWAIIALALLNIATVATVVYNRNPKRLELTVPESGTIGDEVASLEYSGRYFRDQLNLTNEQMARFREFNPDFRHHVRDINIELNDIRGRMLEEMSSSIVDSSKLNLLSDSVGHLHADLKKLTYRYYLDFKEICNKDQTERLDQLFAEMFTTDIHSGQHEPGGPSGRGRGRRFIN
ncbi:MAG: periplasmic heavy metal sensor [Bacteroidales bacterium]|nr:periplasmic heavy metal sensor [Bacteroidales bacterium]